MIPVAASRWAARLSPAGSLSRWGADERGLAAIEFALVLPIMVTMYLGLTEISFLVNTNRKLDLTSRTVGDLTGRASAMTAGELVNVMSAAEAVMMPYKTKDLGIVVSTVTVTRTTDAAGKVTATGTVAWSCKRASATTIAPASDPAPGTTVPVPAGFDTASAFVRTKVTMPYAPLFGSGILQSLIGQASINLEHAMGWPVRDTGQVAWSGSGGACK